MERVTADEAVRAYYLRALERAGGKVPQLLDSIAHEAGEINRRTANKWKTAGEIPGFVLVAIYRTWPELSLDDAAGAATRPASLERRVADLEDQLRETRRLLDELSEGLEDVREQVELPALEYPDRDLPASGDSSPS